MGAEGGGEKDRVQSSPSSSPCSDLSPNAHPIDCTSKLQSSSLSKSKMATGELSDPKNESPPGHFVIKKNLKFSKAYMVDKVSKSLSSFALLSHNIS